MTILILEISSIIIWLIILFIHKNSYYNYSMSHNGRIYNEKDKLPLKVYMFIPLLILALIPIVGLIIGVITFAHKLISINNGNYYFHLNDNNILNKFLNKDL